MLTHKRLGRDPKRVLAISDCHVPRHDPPTWNIFLRAIRDLKPDGVWIVGDFVDLSSVNRHEKAPGDTFTLKQEEDAGNAALDQISVALGKRAVELLYVDGNHEDRLRRYIASGRCPPELRDRIEDIPETLRLRDRGWRYVHPDDQPCYPFDRFALFHGKWYPKHHAAKHADVLACSGLYGHTHRPQVYTTQNVHGTVVMTGMPCSRRLVAEWEHQRTAPFNGWLTGFAVVEVMSRRPHVYPVLVQNGEAAYGGHSWRGR